MVYVNKATGRLYDRIGDAEHMTKAGDTIVVTKAVAYRRYRWGDERVILTTAADRFAADFTQVGVPFALDVRDAVLALAAKEVGTLETQTNKGDILKYTGGREEPYCAHFIAWLFRQVGKPLPEDQAPSKSQHNPLANVKAMMRMCQARGWLIPVPTIPQAGDIVFFGTRMDSDPAAGGSHVGIVVGMDGTKLITIEANTSMYDGKPTPQGVQRKVRTLGGVIGYGRVFG